MERLRTLALGMIICLNAVATVVAFGESYFGLYRWATEHGVAGFWGGVWPMMVDLIILVAEAALFVAHHDKWKTRHKAWLWSVMFTALGVSTGANTGHVHSTDYLSHLTAALPPVALMFTMTVGFGVMKRTFMNKPSASARPAERSHVGTVPWIETSLTETSHPAVSPAETQVPETVAPDVPDPVQGESQLTETLMSLGFKATEKSYTMPRDPREEISLPEKRVRDMYDVDPDISVNAIAQALGIAWATAKKHLDATKEARGLTA
jgi:hypothetical protein